MVNPQEEPTPEQVPKQKIIGTEPMIKPKQTRQQDATNNSKQVSFEEWLQH